MLTQTQIGSIVEEIKQDKRVQAILITGSYAYGTPADESDLDIRMVANNGFQKAHWDDLWRFGVRIEAFYNTPAFIRDLFEKACKEILPPNVIHFWANGKIVYDPTGIAKTLQEEAKQLWKQGPANGGKWSGEKEERYKNIKN